MEFQYLILLTIVSLVRFGNTVPVLDTLNKQNASSLIVDNTAENRFENIPFGLVVKLPDEWYTVDNEYVRLFTRNFGYRITPNGISLSKQFSIFMRLNRIPIFGYTKYSFEATDTPHNPYIMGFALNTTGGVNIKDECDVSLDLEDSIEDKCHEVDLNGNKFARLRLPSQLEPIKTIMYGKKGKNGNYLIFVTSSVDSKTANDLEHTIMTIKFSD